MDFKKPLRMIDQPADPSLKVRCQVCL